LLKTYIEIATSGDLSLLIISGDHSKNDLVERWEQIIHENGTKNGDRHFQIYFQLLKAYSELIAEHTIVACYLTLMTFDINFEWINEVRNRGYSIDTTTSESYAKTLLAAKRKVTNLNTRAEMKRKEIERTYPPSKEGEELTYEEVVGKLELALGEVKILVVIDPEKLTLAKYNILKEGIKKKHQAYERANRSNKRR
jgi:hypothetical protein